MRLGSTEDVSFVSNGYVIIWVMSFISARARVSLAFPLLA